MGSLSQILNNRSIDLTAIETNLQQGSVYSFAPGVEEAGGDGTKTFCWISPGTGTVEIEIWGAAGSGARMCCCGGGVPGNPGAYAKKTIAVTGTSYVCGNIGLPCNNLDMYYRGVSEPTCVCWVSGVVVGAMCAQGGNGGCTVCVDGVAIPNCMSAFCQTQLASAGCAIICNYCCLATATGGDINCPGGFSCASFYHCNACCTCSWYYHLTTSPGIFSEKGATINFTMDGDSDYSHAPGQMYVSAISAVNALTRSPKTGFHWVDCWNSRRGCACYDNIARSAYMPPGIPGAPPTVCPGVRDNGTKGGTGMVRIRFIGA